MSWLPIETAPRDGTKVLVIWQNHPAGARTVESAWFDDEEGEAGQWIGFFGDTGYALEDEVFGWQPLPPLPKPPAD